MTQVLWRKYQTTCFVLPEKINLRRLEVCQTFAIISARNPQGKEQSLHLNLESEKSMQQWIEKYGYEYNRIYGCSPDLDYVEPSLLIDFPNKASAIELAAMFRQNALFWVCDDQLYLVPCTHLLYPEINLGAFSKRLMLANLILNKANT